MTRANNSTLKALEVLERLAEAEDGLRLTDVAASVGYPASTVRRLLVSLIERGYVEQDARTSRYHPGTKILTLQAQGIRRRHVGRRAYPHLTRLRQELDETINLGVPSDTSVIYLETLAPDSAMAFYAPPGTRMPIHCTAMGKVFLAHLPPDAAAALLGSAELKRFTPRTMTSPAAVRAVLDDIAVRGYAVDDEEYATGVRCLAAPVRDHGGKVAAAVSVTALAARFPPEREPEMAAAVRRACLAISADLGFSPIFMETPPPAHAD